MADIPEKYLDLLQQKKAFAALATTMADGSPQVTPVWFDYSNGVVRVNTAKGRVKARNLKQDAAVALAVIDPDNPYRYIQIRGRVRRCTEEGAGATKGPAGQEDRRRARTHRSRVPRATRQRRGRRRGRSAVVGLRARKAPSPVVDRRSAR